jgi:hypothetical protein
MTYLRKAKTYFAVCTISLCAVLGAQPAKADMYDFFKDVYDSAANVSVRGLFNQVWIAEYGMEGLKKQYGTQASGVAWQACRNEIGFRTSSWYIAPSVPVIREEDGKYNCFQRVWGEKSK